MEYYTGGHPLPNEDSFASARAALRLLRQMGERDFVFFLISGGGSAMFELPLDERISLEETRALYQALVGSGATIAEINTVRKHFSAVKGGRLAAAAGRAGRLLLAAIGCSAALSRCVGLRSHASRLVHSGGVPRAHRALPSARALHPGGAGLL